MNTQTVDLDVLVNTGHNVRCVRIEQDEQGEITVISTVGERIRPDQIVRMSHLDATSKEE